MKPFLAIIAHVDVMARNILARVADYEWKFVVTTNVAWILITLIDTMPVNATTIVGLIDMPLGSRQIILAADSGHLIESRSKRGPIIRDACKLWTRQNCAFGFSGYVATESYNLNSLALAACGESNELDKQVEAFVQKATEPIAQHIAQMKRVSPDEYKEILNDPKGYTSGLFAGVEDGNLHLIVQRFLIDEMGIPHSTIQDSDERYPRSRVSVVGVEKEVAHWLGQQPIEYWESTDSIELARKLVQIEIDGRPREVAGPVALLQIRQKPDANGLDFHWICYGRCQDKNEKYCCPSRNAYLGMTAITIIGTAAIAWYWSRRRSVSYLESRAERRRRERAR